MACLTKNTTHEVVSSIKINHHLVIACYSVSCCSFVAIRWLALARWGNSSFCAAAVGSGWQRLTHASCANSGRGSDCIDFGSAIRGVQHTREFAASTKSRSKIDRATDERNLFVCVRASHCTKDAVCIVKLNSATQT